MIINEIQPIPMFKVLMSPDAPARVAETMMSGYIGQGERVKEFEEKLGSIYGRPVLAMNSCTAAIDIALILSGVGPGSVVICPPINCTAGASMVLNRGATIVWADVDPITGLISPLDVQRKLRQFHRRGVKAIMAVDWGGASCDYDRLNELAEEAGIFVIQDAAHKGPVPLDRTSGHWVAWSYQAIKFLTTGDGGALACPDKTLFSKAKLTRWYGLDRESSASYRCSQNVQTWGLKAHLHDLAATIGLANLDLGVQAVATHRRHAQAFCEAFSHLTLERHGIQAPEWNPESSWWTYTILVNDRDGFASFAAQRGIETSQVHARNDRHDTFCFPSGDLPGVDAFSSRQLSIPVGWWLTDEDHKRVASTVLAWGSR